MYNSRKTKVRFAKGQLVSGGLTGLSLAPDSAKAEPSAFVPVPAPPSPAPPSPELSLESEPEAEVYDEYTQHAKQQTKAKLESITGRMFQVLNDYEDDHPDEDLQPDLELRNNIQSMITGYKDTCLEREDLLTSLADWFEDDHIENMLDDIQQRRVSVGANPEGLRASLLEGKKASQRLKAINEQIIAAENRGLDTEHLKQEREELEKELMTKINLVDEIEGVTEEGQGMPVKTIDTAVTDSWKFAAVEICNMLHQVRESGSEELHELDDKIQGLLYSMNEQSQIIEQLNSKVQQQAQMAVFSDQTTIKLSADNSLLHEEVELLRGQLVEAKHTISSLQADLHRMEIKAEFESKRATAANQKKAMSAKNKRPKSSAKDGDEVAKYETQISDLCLEMATLTQENDELKMTVETIEKEFDDSRQLFENEIARYRAEIERLMQQSSPHMEQQPAREKAHTSSSVVPNTPTQLSTIPELGKETVSPTLTQRRQSQNDGALKPFPVFGSDRRKSSVSGKDVQLLQIKLLDKDNQLKKSHENSEMLQDKLIALENELQNMRKENDGLMKLQEKSAALIGQASTCLQIKSEQNSHKEINTSETSPSQERTRIVNTTLTHQTESQPHAVTPTVDNSTESHKELPESVSSQEEKSSVPIFWDVMGSLDDGKSKFGMPEELTQEEKKAESLQLVVKLIEQVNGNEFDFGTTDSKALKHVQKELQKISRLVTGFLEYSSNLVNDEADVMSNAMDSLMSQLPEDEKPTLPRTALAQKERVGYSQARMSIAEVKYADRKKLTEKVVHFADQAIDVLKAGERALNSKINTQQKDLQVVLHAMKDHKQRQSMAFTFTPPDTKELLLKAHAVSTHDISSKQSHLMQHSQGQQSDKRRALIERLRKYTRPQGNPNIFYESEDPDTRGYRSFKGLGSNLFTYNSRNPSRGGTSAMALSQGQNRSQTQNMEQGRPNMNSFLQINATQDTHKTMGLGSTQHRQQFTDSTQVSTPQPQVVGDLGNSLAAIGRRKKAKLHKPFHFQHTLNVESSANAPPKTAPAGVARFGRTTSKTASRAIGRNTQIDATRKDPSSTGSQQPDATTFFDLLSHSNTAGRRTSHSVNNDQPLKLPPLSNL